MPVVAVDTLFQSNRAGLNSPVENIVLLTDGDDDNELAHPTRGISFTTAGALKVTTVAGQTVIIPNGALAAGVIHPLRVKKVFNTGTDAAGIVAYY